MYSAPLNGLDMRQLINEPRKAWTIHFQTASITWHNDGWIHVADACTRLSKIKMHVQMSCIIRVKMQCSF